MRAPVVSSAHHLVEEYRRFLRTSYRFLDPALRAQFESHLAAAEVVVRGPYVTLARDFQPGATLKELVQSGRADAELLRIRWAFGDQPLFRHQEQALESGRAGRPFVVTTGTGSGKTECFLLPVLDGIVRRKREGVGGVQALFLYPMNALANDQLERLRRMLRGSGVNVSYALYTGDSEAAVRKLGEEAAETERVTRVAIRQNPPDILLTNYKQLEFLLVRKKDRGLFGPALRYLVLDEIHSYRGALATEIACLIRRLKAHAGIGTGDLLPIGTSATVTSGAGGVSALADFATVLFGESVRAEHVIRESLVAPAVNRAPWTPPCPNLGGELLASHDLADDETIVSLAERLTGRSCPPGEPLADRIGAVLAGNAIVEALEEVFSRPASLEDAVAFLREHCPDRADQPVEIVRREIEAYLLVGSAGDEEHPPRLRPKLHLFFHGVYDVALCLNPSCRSLVAHGATECLKCGSAARPAALCRTCGQDFVKLRFESESDDQPAGTGDFYSDERSAFLTPKVHELPEAPGVEDEEIVPEEWEATPAKKAVRVALSNGKLDPVGICISCGRILARRPRQLAPRLTD
jgi:hypothetical protein